MTRALLDTDIFSEVIKGRDANVASTAAAYVEKYGKLTISAVTAVEVVYGLRRAGRLQQLATFEATLASAADVLPLGEAAGLLAGRIEAELEVRGTPIGIADVMMAAVAIVNGLAIVTGNVAHFESVRAAGHALTIEN